MTTWTRSLSSRFSRSPTLPFYSRPRSRAINHGDYKASTAGDCSLFWVLGDENFVSAVRGIEKWNALHALFRSSYQPLFSLPSFSPSLVFANNMFREEERWSWKVQDAADFHWFVLPRACFSVRNYLYSLFLQRNQCLMMDIFFLSRSLTRTWWSGVRDRMKYSRPISLTSSGSLIFRLSWVKVINLAIYICIIIYCIYNIYFFNLLYIIFNLYIFHFFNNNIYNYILSLILSLCLLYNKNWNLLTSYFQIIL